MSTEEALDEIVRLRSAVEAIRPICYPRLATLMKRRQKGTARRTQLERLEPHPAGGALFDHLVSLGEHQNWDLKAEGVSGLEIDHQLYLSALLDWEVSRLGALKNFSDVDPCLLICLAEVASVTH